MPARSTLLLLLALMLAACGDGGPDALPDRVIAVRNEGIVEISLATGDERLLLPATDEAVLLEPAVSPDGRQLAYTRQLVAVVVPGEEFDAGADVYVAGIDGSDPRPVREHTVRGELVGAPSWLPDGDLIVSFQRFEAPAFVTGVDRIDLATGDVTRVLDDGFAASVSPDGERLLFVRTDDQFVQTLWTANIDGSEPRPLLGPDEGLGTFHSPRMSPDGATVAVAAGELLASGVSAGGGTFGLRAGAYNGLPADVWLIDAGGGNPRLLADLDLDSPSLAWSGDGARLFVFSGQGLFALDPIDGSQITLAEGTFHGQLDWLAGDAPEDGS